LATADDPERDAHMKTGDIDRLVMTLGELKRVRAKD
jgi:hypothetical protein